MSSYNCFLVTQLLFFFLSHTEAKFIDEKYIMEKIIYEIKIRGLIAPSWIFIRIALLRYGSYTIHFIQLRCTIQWSLVYSQSWATTMINFRTFLSPPKETPYPFTVKSSLPSTPPPNPVPRATINFLLVSMDLCILDTSWKWDRCPLCLASLSG